MYLIKPKTEETTREPIKYKKGLRETKENKKVINYSFLRLTRPTTNEAKPIPRITKTTVPIFCIELSATL